MFKTQQSLTNNLSFEEVMSSLKRHSSVDGILVMGSGGNNTLLPHGDYDLVVVLKELSIPVFSVFTYINQRITDVFFFTTNQLDSLLSKEGIDADDIEGKLVSWLKDGMILLDNSGRLGKLKQKTTNQSSTEVTESKKYASWFGMNFNYAHNVRYFDSGDDLYLQALDIRLLYCVAEVLTGYFTLRDIPWRGEKAAIKWLKENDSKFLELFNIYSSTGNRNNKMEIYSKLVEIALSPIGKVWDKNFTGVTLKENFSQANLDKGIEFWNNLVSQ